LAVPGPSAVVTAKTLDPQTTRVSDRSLDEFARGDDADEAADADGGDPPADPSVPTMRWSADGAACDACGTTIQRRWRDGEERRSSGRRPSADATFVCADCKEW